jgi:YbbR domain-containing protein
VKRVWPFHHAGLKVLAVGLAVLLWLVVSGDSIVERGLRGVPLELLQFPAGLELQTEPPSTVDVRVRGGSGALSQLSSSDIVAVLDLHAARAGQRLFHLTPEQVRVPFGVEIVQITPTTVAMVFENSASKLVPVVPAIEGNPAPGFVVGKITSEPESVEIVGPESSVKRAAAALTEPVSVAGSRSPVRNSVTVGLLDPALRLKATRSALVEVQVVPAPLERVIHNLPVHGRRASSDLTAQFTPATVDVTVRGTRESLSEIGSGEVTAYVDVSGLGVGKYSLPARAESEREIGVTHIEPPTVQVRITRDKH